jgi:hypothetical protein
MFTEQHKLCIFIIWHEKASNPETDKINGITSINCNIRYNENQQKLKSKDNQSIITRKTVHQNHMHEYHNEFATLSHAKYAPHRKHNDRI